ncbi:ATPase [Pseudomonas folii]|uniref:ATPase n=1 Tax=Pseudomonas folii TaxID=2762593 RepID=A0ABR7AUU6_9PSED|nr:ATPase [Pseudomonas folii]MBC3948674.1 ATPase [Pseudomonas folii]
MSEADQPVAKNQICKQGAKTTVHDRGTQCYFRPETEEFVFISPCQATNFENHWREMSVSMDAFHTAKANYSGALEYSKDTPGSVAEKAKDVAAVETAEREMEEKRKELQKKLGDLSVKGMSYDDVVELIPVLGQGSKSKGGIRPTRFAYVRKAYFSQIESGLKLHLVSLKGSDERGGAKSIYSIDKSGNTQIDMKKLTQQLTALQKPKAKLDLQKVMKWMGSDFDPDTLNKDFALFDWAKSWTYRIGSDGGVQQEQTGHKGDTANVDVTGGAQFMRFVSNVGMNAEFDPKKGQAVFKGEAKSSLALASGVVSQEFYAPDRIGWKLAMQLDDGQEINLGMLRLRGEAELSGFAGASLQLEAQVQVVTNGKQQALVGQSGGRLPRLRERKDAGIKFYKAMDAKDEGLHLGGEVFAGARLEGSLKGALQWLKPTPPPDPEKPLSPILKSTGTYTDFCTVGNNIAGLAGAGAGVKFYCTFLNGKFCFHVAASLCWGVGAKGGFIAEVDAATIVEFGAWLVYQLYSLDYGFFEAIDERAFKAYSQYCVIKASVGENIYRGYDWMVTTPDDIAKMLTEIVDGLWGHGTKGLEASKGRNFLARNVIDFREDLLLHTPEAKGILLYLLTRHGKLDHIDPENRTPSGDIYKDRKSAVIWVLTSIQTVSEWEKVLCHMSADGSSLTGATSAAEVAREQEAHLVNFLQEGYNRDDELIKARQELVQVYNRLKKTSAIGYALAMNNTSYYKFNNEPNYNYPQRCVFGPCASDSSEYV